MLGFLKKNHDIINVSMCIVLSKLNNFLMYLDISMYNGYLQYVSLGGMFWASVQSLETQLVVLLKVVFKLK